MTGSRNMPEARVGRPWRPWFICGRDVRLASGANFAYESFEWHFTDSSKRAISVRPAPLEPAQGNRDPVGGFGEFPGKPLVGPANAVPFGHALRGFSARTIT